MEEDYVVVAFEHSAIRDAVQSVDEISHELFLLVLEFLGRVGTRQDDHRFHKRWKLYQGIPVYQNGYVVDDIHYKFVYAIEENKPEFLKVSLMFVGPNRPLDYGGKQTWDGKNLDDLWDNVILERCALHFY